MRYLVLMFCLSVVGFTEASITSCPQSFCMAVVDAGSTGSRIHLFGFDRDEKQNPINIHELDSQKVKPGLAQVLPKADSIDKYLQDLMVSIPSYRLPVYFYATAGMRLLPEPKQAEIYGLVQTWFDKQLEWDLKDIKTITGTEEGIFAWLAINNQLALDPVGILDMGGASTQIAFPVTDLSNIAQEDLKTVRFKGQEVKLFVKSFLGLGQTEFLKKIANIASCFPDNYPMPTGGLGKGDAFLCEQGQLKVLASFPIKSLVKPVIAANSIKNWYSLGAPASTIKSNTFSQIFKEGSFSSFLFRSYVNDAFCHNNWITIQQSYPKDAYTSGYCLFSTYYHALFAENYGIDQDKTIKTLNNGSIEDWTLGVLFNA